MPDIGEFFLTWFSYLLIFSFILYALLCLLERRFVSLSFVADLNWIYGGLLSYVVLFLGTICAIIFQLNPFLWLWQWMNSLTV